MPPHYCSQLDNIHAMVAMPCHGTPLWFFWGAEGAELFSLRKGGECLFKSTGSFVFSVQGTDKDKAKEVSFVVLVAGEGGLFFFAIAKALNFLW